MNVNDTRLDKKKKKDMRAEYFIFGLQRSGTNFTETLMAKNFNGRKMNANVSAWKHSIEVPKGYTTNTPTIVIYKNPYTWVESVALRNQVDWLKRQTRYPADQECDAKYQLGEKKFNVINLAKTYKHFYNTWILNNPCEKRVIVKYEDLLKSRTLSENMKTIESSFKFIKSHNKDGWDTPQRGRVSQSKDYTIDRENYYLTMKPKMMLKTHIQAVNEHIGEDVITSLGYEIL